MLPIRASEGHPGYPGPTRNRALAHQGETDLFADGLPKYRTGLRSNSFIQSGSASQHRSQLAMTSLVCTYLRKYRLARRSASAAAASGVAASVATEAHIWTST